MARIGSKCSDCLFRVDGSKAIRKLTSSLRAVFSARSMSRAIQNRFSAVRLSMLSFQHPGVLGAASLARIDHQRALPQRHAGETAGYHAGLLARQHERPEIDVARHDRAVD